VLGIKGSHVFGKEAKHRVLVGPAVVTTGFLIFLWLRAINALEISHFGETSQSLSTS
jgi:hypothetical protein